ncbi:MULTISPECIES: HNH endonuclease [unclassified Clostridium]|uniref:HNH endonuclease n=1 Tax=unclassified Clostridium TaxID=2614128 RepID=UPI00338E1B65
MFKRDKVQNVYNHPQWTKTRIEAIKIVKGLCEVCKTHEMLRTGNEVHHIVKVSSGDGSNHYDLDNLIYV